MKTIVCVDNLDYNREMFNILLNEINDCADIIYSNVNLPYVSKLMFSHKTRALFSAVSIYELDRLVGKYGNTEELRIIFFNVALRYYTYEKLCSYKIKHPNIKLDLVFLDAASLASSIYGYELIKKDRELFNQIFTISNDDAKTWGGVKIYTPYSKNAKINEMFKAERIYDLYWAGTLKGREKYLIELKREMQINGVDFVADMFDWSRGGRKIVGIGRIRGEKEFYSYGEILKKTAQSNVILDIVNNSIKNPLTLRVYEAIVYNKKLLTNNPEIFKFKETLNNSAISQ